MNIYYDHVLGKVEKQSVILSSIYATDVADEELALDKGFLYLKDDIWYNCRSTRIKPYAINRNFKFSAIHKQHYNQTEYFELYHEFLENRGFASDSDDWMFFNRDSVIEYYLNNKLVGFSKLRHYQESVELNLHCNIVSNKSFSYETLLYEINLLKDLKYIYLGPGYEKSSIYKSKIDNFEWFTGKEWSKDVAAYSAACERDSNLHLTTSS
jgi:hypothetical protein